MNRRHFLQRSALSAATLAGISAPHFARSAEQLASREGQKPRKIIHIVSDGMSMGTLSCADQFSRSIRGRGLSWMDLWARGGTKHGLMDMRSLNSIVPDSAAAASSWGSGSRVVNGALNYLPDGRALKTLYSLFAEAGWKRALVTTAEITHATPAGFAANVHSRENPQAIAKQYLERDIDILLGGGKPFFDARKRKDKRDLKGDFRTAGYTVVESRAELLNAPNSAKLLGLFTDSHFPYSVDREQDPKLMAQVPTLAEMTRAALARLEGTQNFILQVEGARVDHAAHNSDAAGAIRDQIALDEAIDLCVEFADRNPDTLLVITTDHGNSNLGLNGMGPGYRHSSTRFSYLSQIKASHSEILKAIQRAGKRISTPPIPSDKDDVVVEKKLNFAKLVNEDDEDEKDEAKKTAEKTTKTVELISAYDVDPEAIIAIIGEKTGFKVSHLRAEMFSRVLAGQDIALYDQFDTAVSQLGQLMANRLGIGWTGNTHTSDYVPIAAFGPGAERFNGFLQGTDIFRHYTQLAGINFENPSMPLLAEEGPNASAVERIARYAHAGEHMV
jgi:alkaline phosphatase